MARHLFSVVQQLLQKFPKGDHGKVKTFKACLPSSLSLLQIIFNVFGLNIPYNSSKFHNNTVCDKIALVYIIFLVTVTFSKLSNLHNIAKEKIKYSIYNIAIVFCSSLIWFILFFSERKIVKICKCITRLKNTFKTQHSDTFGMIFVVFTFSKYMVGALCDLYPFTDNIYGSILQYFYFPIFGNRYLTTSLACIAVFIYRAFTDLLPQSFIVLYIILCQDMHTILKLYVRRNNVADAQSEQSTFRWFNYYDFVLNAFQSFESVFSMSILIVLSQLFIDIIMMIFIIIKSGEIFVDFCRTIFNIILITLLILVTSKVSETDNMAKQANLQNLEILMKINKHFQLDKVVKIWRINNSPAFAFTAWGCFRLRKSVYLAIINVIITYTLLVLSL